MKPSERVAVEYEKNKEVLRKEDVVKISEWAKEQPHLPEIDEFEVILYLHSNYYDLEATKTTIENYYTMRTSFSDYFSNRDVTTEKLLEALEVMNCGVLPKRTKEGYTIMHLRLMNCDSQLSTFADNIKVYLMLVDILLQEEGTHEGIVFVFDMAGVSWGHFLKVGIMQTRRYLQYLQEAMPVRIKALMHFNLPSFFDKLLQFSKPFMKESVFQLVKFSSTIEGTYDVIPAECYPSDYPGGTGPSLAEMHETFKKKLLEYRDWFVLDEEQRRVDESKRLKKKGFWRVF